MKMIKGLTKANAAKYNIEVREDLDFSDDGNRFRGFSYKGMPMTQCRWGGECYLSIRVDYLNTNFTYREWMETKEYKLTDEFNGVSEFDIEKLIENLEAIIAKVDEMNKAAEAEDVDMTPVINKLNDEIQMAKSVVTNFKTNFKWYEAESYTLRSLVDYMKSEEREIERCENTLNNINELDCRRKREMIENLNRFGYVAIKENSYYLEKLREAIA